MNLQLLLSFTELYEKYGFVPVTLPNTSNPWIDLIESGEIIAPRMMGLIKTEESVRLEVASLRKDDEVFPEVWSAHLECFRDQSLDVINAGRGLDLEIMLNEHIVSSCGKREYLGRTYYHGIGLDLSKVETALNGEQS